MIEPLTPIQKLDQVLTCMAQDRGHSKLTGVIALVERISGVKYPADKMLQILGKLEKDGFLQSEDRFSSIEQTEIRIYYITFEGDYFINERGGYRQKKIELDLRRRKIELENSQNQLNQILLVIGAIGAALGAIALVAWEMYKYFHLEHHR